MDKQILAAAGFDLGWLQSIEQKYGPVVFGVIGDFMNQGFSPAWVVATIDKLHPLMMDVLYKVFAIPALATARLGAAAESVAGATTGGLDGIVSKEMMIFLLEKALALLPTLGLSGWKLAVATSGIQILLSVLKGQS